MHEAAEAALSPAAPPVPKPVPPEPPVPQPQILAEPAPPPEPVREAIRRFAFFEPASLVFFERAFNGSKTPTILQHCLFGGALACALDDSGRDAAGLKRHLDAQAQVLHRIALHEKLGKKAPIGEYAGALLADFEALLPHAVTKGPTGPAGALVLMTELSEPTAAVVKKLAEDRQRWDFVKARQLALAFQAQSARTSDPKHRAAVESALREYAQTSMTTLQKLFVRLRVDRTTGVLAQNEPALDAAARTLHSAMAAALRA